MQTGPGRLTVNPPMAEIVFHRPEVLNAMNMEAWYALDKVLEEVTARADIRVVLLRGEGRAFCAGADLNDMAEHVRWVETGEWTVPEIRRAQRFLQSTTRRMRRAEQIFVAAVQGFALGAGCEVICACDVVVAEESAKFGFPETGVGVTVTNGGLFFLPRLIGLAQARWLIYAGEFVNGKQAKDMGLVAITAPDGQALERARAAAQRIAAQAPIALAMMKEGLDRSMETSLESVLAFETEALVSTVCTLDHREGARAFFEKRPPKFTGK